MDIEACPSCASLRMRLPTLAAGGILGYSTVTSVCADCGFQGAAMVFRDPARYQDFLRSVQAAPTVPAEQVVEGADTTLVGGAAEADLVDSGIEDLTPEERAFIDDLRSEPVRHRRPTVTVFFIAILGGTLMVATPFAMVATVGTLVDPGLVKAVFAAGTIISALEGWAFVRIARRMWLRANMG